jgi:ParB-like chromosome segregation protein Spo0J
MKVEEINLSEIKPYEFNPRKNEKAIEKVAASLREFGWKQPIVVDEQNVVLAGHTRLAAAISLSYQVAPVVVAEGLTDAQKAAYRIADNKTAEYSEWDKDLLQQEFSRLMELDADLTSTSFSLEDIAGFSDEFLEWEDDDDQFENEESEASEENLLGELNSAHVKMVLIYLNTETEPVFREMAEKLQERFGTENLSDTIFKVVEDGYKNI